MEKLIKSPMNYTGGKYKLLPQMLPLFPKDIDTFVDLFCGGLNVGINVEANRIIGNDICKEVIEVYRGIKKEGPEQSLKLVKDTIEKFELSKTNEEGYRKIREYYNNGNKEWYIFYSMLMHSFSYIIEFSKKGKFTTPFGRNRSWFNPTLEKKFVIFSEAIKEKDIILTTEKFNNLKIEKLKAKDFVYLDPPYLLAGAKYNKTWDITKEQELLNLCDRLDDKGIKFALSNVLELKGKENSLLKEWGEKYNINYLNFNYRNCCYQRRDKDDKTIEVLITNYTVE